MSGTNTGPVVVVATITPVEGCGEEVEAALREAIPRVHEEPGCERYSLHRSRDGAFVFIEKWSDREALKVHGTAPALTELGSKLEGLLDGEIDVQVLVPLPAGTPEQGAL